MLQKALMIKNREKQFAFLFAL